MPITAAAVVIGCLSLIGIPGTAGFISKWILVQGALANGWWHIALLIVLSSLLSVIYVWRLIETLYVVPTKKVGTITEAPISMLAPMWIIAFACLFFGVFTDFILDPAQIAAQNLLSLPGGGIENSLGDGS